MKRLILGFTGLVLTLSFTACGYSPSQDSLSSLAQASTPTAADFEKSLTGTWARACLYDSSAQNYYVEKIAFSGSDESFQIVTQDYFYTDSNCANLALYRTQRLTVLNVTQSGSGWIYEASISGQTYEPVTTAQAQLMHNNTTCGLTNWFAGVPNDTSGTGCSTTSGITDYLILSNNSLFRSLDEVLYPDFYSGTTPKGTPYVKVL